MPTKLHATIAFSHSCVYQAKVLLVLLLTNMELTRPTDVNLALWEIVSTIIPTKLHATIVFSQRIVHEAKGGLLLLLTSVGHLVPMHVLIVYHTNHLITKAINQLV